VRDFSQIVDVWRLVNYVNNDSEDRKTSLNASVQKFLGIEDFKEPFFKKMIELGFAKDSKDAHRKIAMLPDDLLKEYNILDVVYTMRLYHYCIDKLKAWGYLDYARDDYKLYSVESLLYSKSYLRGIEIDRALCFSNLTELNLERDALITEVYEHDDIIAYEKVINRDVCLTDADARKWLKANGIVAPIKKGTGVALLSEEVAEDLLEAKKSRFNLRSSKQLRELFIETLKFPILKLTDGGDNTY
jgi:DNA polymerase I-like protein with 3'-5' exonuclease and polymerase domains